MTQPPVGPPYDYQFRLILIGDSTVGKSTLLRVFTESQFTSWSDPTVGVDFFAKTITLPKNDVRIKLQIWDTAGQEKFRSITRSYYRSSVGALLLYDITCRKSFEHLVDWLSEIRRFVEPNRAMLLIVACKSDKHEEREVTTEEGKAFAEFYGIDFIETSAKKQWNVEKAFTLIAESIYGKVISGEFTMDDDWDGVRVPETINGQNLLSETSDRRNASEKSFKCC